MRTQRGGGRLSAAAGWAGLALGATSVAWQAAREARPPERDEAYLLAVRELERVMAPLCADFGLAPRPARAQSITEALDPWFAAMAGARAGGASGAK